jgi:methionine synthase II (cobalamin-independent)
MYAEHFPGIKIDSAEKRVYVERTDRLMEEIGMFYEDFLNENFDAFAIGPEHAQGLHKFLESLGSRSDKVPLAKGQVTGPLTFGLGLNDQDMKPVWFDPEYRDVVLKGLSMKAAWQVRELKKVAENVILFLDEPIMSALGTPAYMSVQDEDVVQSLNEVINAAQAQGARVGVHCCGNTDWGLLARTDVDIMAFDAYFYAEKVRLYAADITAFLERGKNLAWGLVPTSSHTSDACPVQSESAQSLRDQLERELVQFIAKGIPEDRLRSQLIFTPSCGMGTLPIDDTHKVLELLGQLGEGF